MKQKLLIYKNNPPFKQFKKLSFNSKQDSKESVIKILILGSGFAGIEVFKHLQQMAKNSNNIEITLVSKDNFFLFTPMLPEVVSGMIEIRHIVTPVRTFCKNARFYEADIKSID